MKLQCSKHQIIRNSPIKKRFNNIKCKKDFIKIVLRPLYAILWISIFVFVPEQHCCGMEEKSNPYIPDIIEVFNSIQITDKQFLSKVTFEMSDNQPKLSGGSIKFLLQGSDRNKWLFKGTSSKRALASYRLAQLFDINTPEIYPITLIINNRTIKGQVQRFIDSDPNINLKDNFTMREKQEDLIKLQIFHWLVDKREDTFYHLLMDQKGRIYTIDLKLTLRYDPIGTPRKFKRKLNQSLRFANRSFFSYFWHQYLESSEEWKLKIPFSFIRYIEDFDPDYLSDLLREYKIDEKGIKKFVRLKQNISQDFRDFLSFIQKKNKAKTDIYFNNNVVDYSWNMLNKLKSILEHKQNVLDTISAREQLPLKIITTYFFMDDFEKKTYKQVLDKIQEKKKEAPNIYELLGLYLLETEILDILQKEKDVKEIFPEEVFIVSLDCDEISLQSIGAKISLLPIQQRFFVTALYHAIKRNSPAALRFLQKSVCSDKEKTLLFEYIEKK